MKRNRNNWRKNNIRTPRMIKSYLLIIGIILVAATLIITFSQTSAQASQQVVTVATSETQFELNISYAYVGPGPSNASSYNMSYASVGPEPSNTSSDISANRTQMAPVSQYSSAVVFNSTRLPGAQITSCDAEIELYSVKITTDRGLAENLCYFVGTNYKPSFSSSELSSLFAHVRDFVSPKNYSTVRGNFEYNMTDNMSLLSSPIGSAGVYSNFHSGLGLWSAGKPNAISVTVQRIGYMTISNGYVSQYKDDSNKSATAVAQLSNHENGFIHNNLVPEAKMPQTDLFHPKP